MHAYYGIAAWGQAALVYLKKVFILQKRALRLMFQLLVTDLMLFLCLSLLMSYPSICFILKQYVPLCTTYLPILRLRISVIFLLVHLTFTHVTLDFLMLVIFMLINQDSEFNLIRFPFSELNCGIA